MPQVVHELAHEACQAGASDIHIQMIGKTAQVAFRLDGLITPLRTLPEPMAERVCGRIKFLAKLKTYQESMPQDGRIDKADLGIDHDVRVATYPTVTGEKLVLRLFQNGEPPALDELGLPIGARDALVDFMRQSTGLLLLTGPAGSGKTTTIYACLRHLAASGGRHVITVEDPVEQIIPGIMQTEVCEARGLTFATAARHLLRQDPQVLVMGEIRDEQTAGLAVRAALTGHQVISTLHAGSCQGVLERLFNMVSDRYSVAAALGLVMNQRLARRLCRACGGKGCPTCYQTGYRGRFPLAEWVVIDDAMRTRIRQRGMDGLEPEMPLEEAFREAVGRNLTTMEECQRVLGKSLKT